MRLQADGRNARDEHQNSLWESLQWLGRQLYQVQQALPEPSAQYARELHSHAKDAAAKALNARPPALQLVSRPERQQGEYQIRKDVVMKAERQTLLSRQLEQQKGELEELRQQLIGVAERIGEVDCELADAYR